MTVAERRAQREGLPDEWTVVMSPEHGRRAAYIPLWHEVVRSTYPYDERAPLNAAVLWPAPDVARERDRP